MKKGVRWEDHEDDWGTPKRSSTSSSESSNSRNKGQARWIITGIIAVVTLYAVLAIFSKNMNTSHIITEHKFIPNSPHSMGGSTVDLSNRIQGGTEKAGNVRLDCTNKWTKDVLVGRCFGLTIHSKFNELANIEVVESAEECKSLCCELGEKCMTWQYWNDNKRCNLGPKVRVGAEADSLVDGSMSWCEAEAPVVWRGRRIQSRDGPKCEWGDSLPTQCHGLGAEKRGEDGNRLARNVCERACCFTAGCTMWQQHPERGCFVGGGENVICESYTGTFIGGMKKHP